jgi:hypothetical protein
MTLVRANTSFFIIVCQIFRTSNNSYDTNFNEAAKVFVIFSIAALGCLLRTLLRNWIVCSHPTE